MQENKKKNPQKNLERENHFFVRKNYAQNRGDNDKFIVRGCK